MHILKILEVLICNEIGQNAFGLGTVLSNGVFQYFVYIILIITFVLLYLHISSKSSVFVA